MKKRLLYLPIFLMTMSLCGCSPQLTTQNYTHEAGETLPTEVTAYATFEKPEKAAEAVLNMDTVDPNKVGTYEAVITLKNKEYPFTVEVVDTTAPEGTFSILVAVAGIDDKVTADAFQMEYTDVSEISYGIRNAELVKSEDELKEMFGVLQQTESGGEIRLDEMLGLTWNSETDTWDEKDISKESISEEFVPEESGLYSVEVIAVDDSGNADVIKCYVLSDLKAPEFTKSNDISVRAESEFAAYFFHHRDDLEAEDNLLGNLTNNIALKEFETVESSDKGAKVKYEYTITDIAGNETSVERMMNIDFTAKTSVAQSGTTVEVAVSNGFDRTKAEEAFALVNNERVAAGLNALNWDESIYEIACMRAQEILSNYSHTRTATGRTTVEDFSLGENLNRLWGDFSAKAAVNSWMNSPTHKDNLLINYYNRTAVACYQSGKYCYYVQLFDQ